MNKITSADKEIRWVGSAYEDLLAFPYESRKKAGFQLGKVQAGLDPEDWKPFFKKKTQTTSKHDKDITDARYRAIVRDRKGQK